LDILKNHCPKLSRYQLSPAPFREIGVLAYRNFGANSAEPTEFPGWYGKNGTIVYDELVQFIGDLRTGHENDYPEATKTAFIRAYSVMRPDARHSFCSVPILLPQGMHLGIYKTKTSRNRGFALPPSMVVTVVFLRTQTRFQLFVLYKTATRGPRSSL
jgi:hypothetical protein